MMPFLQAEETKSTSSPPTTKSKTVQLRYSTEGHRAEQFVPSLSETTRTKTLQPDDVEDEIELLCDRVAEVLHVEADEAECLLARNKWREQVRTDDWFFLLSALFIRVAAYDRCVPRARGVGAQGRGFAATRREEEGAAK